MFSVKASSITAGAAFLLSLLIGIISGGSFLAVLLRAGICGAIFFGLATGLYILANKFLPELFQFGRDEEMQDENAPGSQVDISVQDEESEEDAETPGPEKDEKNEKSEKKQENENDKDKAFKEAVTAALNPKESAPDESAGLDQNGEKEYTKEEQAAESPTAAAAQQQPETVKPLNTDVPISPEAVLASLEAPPASPKAPPAAAEAEPWEDIDPPDGGGNKPKLPLPGKMQNPGKEEDASKGQDKKPPMDPKKADPRQMASTIQTMLRQE